MASIQSETVQYDQLFSLTERARRSRISDNIGNSQPTLDIFHAAGRVEVEDGGESIEERLLYAYQDVEWMDNRQAVNTSDKEGVTKAVFPWRFALAPINIAKTDEAKAMKSETSAMDFSESKIIQARQGIRTAANTAMCGLSSGKVMLGFQDLVRDDVDSGTLGGINLATSSNSWFRSNASTSAVTFTTQTVSTIYNGWATLSDLYEDCSDVNEEATHIGAGSTLFSKMLQTLEGVEYTRFVGGEKKKLNAGGNAVGSGPGFRNAVIYKDRAFAASHIYIFNINTLKLKVLKGMNFQKTNFTDMQAVGVMAKVSFYMVGLQFVPLDPRRNGVATAVS